MVSFPDPKDPSPEVLSAEAMDPEKSLWILFGTLDRLKYVIPLWFIEKYADDPAHFSSIRISCGKIFGANDNPSGPCMELRDTMPNDGGEYSVTKVMLRDHRHAPSVMDVLPAEYVRPSIETFPERFFQALMKATEITYEENLGCPHGITRLYRLPLFYRQGEIFHDALMLLMKKQFANVSMYGNDGEDDGDEVLVW